MTAKCSACHSGFFSGFPGRTMNVTKVSRSPESISHNFANVLFVLMSFWWHSTFQWSRATWKRTVEVNEERTNMHAHTHKYTQRHTLCGVCHSTCAFEKKTKQLSFFIRQPWGDTPLFSLPGEFQWASQKGWASWSAIWEAIRCWAGHHSTVKGIPLMWRPSDQLTSAE